MAEGSTESLIQGLRSDCLLNIMHQSCKELVDILLYHRSDQLSVDFDCFNKVVGVDWTSDAFVQISKYFLQLQ